MAEIGIGIATDIGVKVLERVFEGFSSMVKHQISLMWSLDTNIDFLRQSLPIIKGFMMNAEGVILNKELSSEHFSPLTKVFVKALKQFIYDGEDIIDEFEIDVRRGHMNIIRKWKTARKMKKLYDEFKDLKEKKADVEKFLGDLKDELQVHGDEVGSSSKLSRKPSINIIQRDDFKMVGRDKDKKWLLYDLLGNKLKPSVVLLTGMGGIGKTTFAHDILHLPQIVNHFAFRKWVTVGDQNLDPKKVLNHMIDEAADTLIKASEKVRSTLEGKKRFLIVLDDVWEAEDLKHRWNELWAPLSYGGEGSRVIVTTREEQVQSSMQGIPFQVKRLDSLSDEECLEIFESFAFPNGFDIPSSSSPPPPPIHLREIGKQIVNEKVKGVPLAARVIGSSLSGKPYRYWNAALAQLKATNINSVIFWSYLNLSMHLKQCFVYCSLFPKNTCLDKAKIVRLWMAHNFVVKSSTQHNGGMTLVDIGESYFDALVNASLLQVVEDGYESHGYMMHDLIHDFALNILGDEFSEGKDFMIADPHRLRHLVIEEEDQALPQNHSDIKNLQTFMSEDHLHINNFTRDQLKTIKSLTFTGEYYDVSKTFITTLLKKLSQVRYLDISGMEISTLPKSVCSMCALQTLILDDDTIQFPKNMSKKLVELHHIEAGDNVSRISGLGQLKKLHSIGGRFVLHEDNGHCIEELRNLKQLRGKLKIEGLCHLQCIQLVSKEQILENHGHLEKIVFDMDGVTTSEVLNYLQPHENLKALKIKNYMMDRLPTWLGNRSSISYFLSLKELEIYSCHSLQVLPKELPSSLNHLEIYYCHSLQVLPKELPSSLNHLEIHSCNSLQALPKELPSSLKYLLIKFCNNLQSLPKELPFSLEVVEIYSCSSLQTLPKELPSSLNHLRIDSCGNLQALPKELPSFLKKLLIYACNSLQALPRELPSSLEHLGIRSCDNLQVLPKELPSSLENLEIHDCNSFQALPKELSSSLEDLKIHSCNNLQALPKELPSSLEYLKISSCDSLQALPKELPSSLKYLVIYSCNSLQTLPKELPSSLKRLEIYSCNSLQDLPKELPSSLERLWTNSCKNLQTLPKELPSSLNLSIKNCPLLHPTQKHSLW